MLSRGIQSDKFSFLAVINACGQVGQWRRALSFFRQMSDEGVPPTVITYSAVITACAKGGEAEHAELLLEEMEAAGVLPNEVRHVFERVGMRVESPRRICTSEMP